MTRVNNEFILVIAGFDAVLILSAFALGDAGPIVLAIIAGLVVGAIAAIYATNSLQAPTPPLVTSNSRIYASEQESAPSVRSEPPSAKVRVAPSVSKPASGGERRSVSDSW